MSRVLVQVRASFSVAPLHSAVHGMQPSMLGSGWYVPGWQASHWVSSVAVPAACIYTHQWFGTLYQR